MNTAPFDLQRRSFQSVPFAAGEARSFVSLGMRRAGAPAPVVEDFRLVISELVANLVEHGDGTGFEVLLLTEGEWGVIVECSPGAAGAVLPDPVAWEVADPDQSSGRGLGIIRELMDDISVSTIAGRLTISCRQRRPAS